MGAMADLVKARKSAWWLSEGRLAAPAMAVHSRFGDCSLNIRC